MYCVVVFPILKDALRNPWEGHQSDNHGEILGRVPNLIMALKDSARTLHETEQEEAGCRHKNSNFDFSSTADQYAHTEIHCHQISIFSMPTRRLFSPCKMQQNSMLTHHALVAIRAPIVTTPLVLRTGSHH